MATVLIIGAGGVSREPLAGRRRSPREEPPRHRTCVPGLTAGRLVHGSAL